MLFISHAAPKNKYMGRKQCGQEVFPPKLYSCSMDTLQVTLEGMV